jgi:hypothetical protein
MGWEFRSQLRIVSVTCNVTPLRYAVTLQASSRQRIVHPQWDDRFWECDRCACETFCDVMVRCYYSYWKHCCSTLAHYTLLEMLDVFSLCVAAVLSVAPNSSRFLVYLVFSPSAQRQTRQSTWCSSRGLPSQSFPGQKWLRQYTKLRTEWLKFMVRIPTGAIGFCLFRNTQPGSGTQQTSCSVGIAVLPLWV